MFLFKYDQYLLKNRTGCWESTCMDKSTFGKREKIFCWIYLACGVGLIITPVCWFQRGKLLFSDLSTAQQLRCRTATHACGFTSLRIELKYLPTLINICQWIWVLSFLFGEVIKYGFNFFRKHRSIEMTYSSLYALWSVSSFEEITHLIQTIKFISIDFLYLFTMLL